MRYTGDLGCRFRNIPHDMQLIHENASAKWERCHLCGMRRRYTKGYKGRVHNVKYLRDHVRNFAQKFGATKAVYNRIYKPAKTLIRI